MLHQDIIKGKKSKNPLNNNLIITQVKYMNKKIILAKAPNKLGNW
jgi:hypothetical protein